MRKMQEIKLHLICSIHAISKEKRTNTKSWYCYFLEMQTNKICVIMESFLPGIWNSFIGSFCTLNFHLPLGRRDFAKWTFLKFPHFCRGKGQSLIRFVCFFQVKFNFSITTIFFQSSIMTSKIYWSIKWTLI